MTDFVTRDDTNLGVGRILTSPTMYALYDNPTAIAEGAAGAPRIQTAAIQDGAVTEGKLGAGAVAATKLNTSARSFSGTLSSGENALITYSDQYGFFPRISSGGSNIQITRLQGNNNLFVFNSGDIPVSYTITWRYLP